MKFCRPLHKVSILLIVFATISAPASDAELATRLNGLWNQKTLTLRQPDARKEIQFDVQGSKVGEAKVDPWYENVSFQCTGVTVNPDEIILDGKRVTLEFDPRAGKFVELKTKHDVRTRIARGDPSADSTEIPLALAKIFLTQKDTLADAAPDYWETCLRGQIKNGSCSWPSHDFNSTKPSSAKSQSEPVSKIGGGVKPPRVRFSPEPDRELAKEVRIQGTTVLSLLVDTDGKPEHIRITHPAGFGLDEKAVEAIQKWRFDPALKDGKPVAVQIFVEMDFHLY